MFGEKIDILYNPNLICRNKQKNHVVFCRLFAFRLYMFSKNSAFIVIMSMNIICIY